MKTFTNKKGKEFFLIEVPTMAFGFDIQNYTTSVELIYMLDLEKITEEWKDDETLVTKVLPSAGKWKIIGLAKDVNEEVASTIIDGIKAASWGTWYVDYSAKYDKFSFEHATESLSSLIKSLGLNNNVLILENVK